MEFSNSSIVFRFIGALNKMVDHPDAYELGLLLFVCLGATVAALLKFPALAALHRVTNSAWILSIAEKAHIYLLLAIICGLLVASTIMSNRHYRASMKVEAHASILSVEESICSNNGIIFGLMGISEPRCLHVHYEFNAGGEFYEGLAGFADEEADEFNRLRGNYKVCYDPNDPRRSKLQKPTHKCGT